jgi:hypothetical protein
MFDFGKGTDLEAIRNLCLILGRGADIETICNL